MNIMIPLGGLGTRFQKEGFIRPKPFVRVLGKEMLVWIIDNIKLGTEDSLIIVFDPQFLSSKKYMIEIIKFYFPKILFVEVS